MLSEEELHKMRDMDIMEADRDTLVDISEIRIDDSRPVEERMEDYLKQARNPYLLKSGDYVLKLCYQEDGESLEERMKSYLDAITQLK